MSVIEKTIKMGKNDSEKPDKKIIIEGLCGVGEDKVKIFFNPHGYFYPLYQDTYGKLRGKLSILYAYIAISSAKKGIIPATVFNEMRSWDALD